MDLDYHIKKVRRRIDAKEHVIACAKEVMQGYEFKLGAVLDTSRRAVPYTNSVALNRLDKALMSLEEEEE